MSEEEIQNILDELNTVRPEVLNKEAKRLFEAIMQIADDRDKYKDLYNKEKEKNKEIEYIKSCFDFALEQQLSNYISKDKLRKFIKEDSFEETYNFETISKKNLLKFLEDNV